MPSSSRRRALSEEVAIGGLLVASGILPIAADLADGLPLGAQSGVGALVVGVGVLVLGSAARRLGETGDDQSRRDRSP